MLSLLGYENSDKVNIDSLAESLGLESQIAQSKEANKDKASISFNDPEECSSAKNSEVANAPVEDRMECDTDDPKLSKSGFPTGPSFGWPSGVIPPAPPLPPQLMTR